MNINSKHRRYHAWSFVLVLLLASTSYSQDAKKQISIITDEVEKLLSTLKVSNDLTQQCTKDVADTRSYLKSENFFLSLYTIRACKLELDSLFYASSKAEVEKRGMEAFEQEWSQLGASLTNKENKVVVTIAKRPAAVAIALAQVSQVQTRPYYQSGRLFAQNSSLSEGLYYLGRAPSNLDFAIFSRGLNFPQSKTPVTFRSSEPELAKLEAAILKTYKSADVSSQQTNFNRLNSNLKIAGELNRAKMFEGALLKYLETMLFYGLLITAAENEDVHHLRERSKELGSQLKADKTDQSIAALFWEMAETSLNPTSKKEPTPAQVKRAVVILNLVLPGYFDYMKETK